MPATPDDLFAFLDHLGIVHRTVTHPPLFTVEQSQSLRGAIPGAHTKNLFLRDKKGATFLVVAHEDLPIDLKVHARDDFTTVRERRFERGDPYYQSVSDGWTT